MGIERKIIKIGKSYGVTLPVDLLAEHGIKYGDTIEIKSDKEKIVINKSNKVSLPDGISPDFFEVLEETSKIHDEALSQLVDK